MNLFGSDEWGGEVSATKTAVFSNQAEQKITQNLTKVF